jgi:hypothetical protein
MYNLITDLEERDLVTKQSPKCFNLDLNLKIVHDNYMHDIFTNTDVTEN